MSPRCDRNLKGYIHITVHVPYIFYCPPIYFIFIFLLGGWHSFPGSAYLPASSNEVDWRTIRMKQTTLEPRRLLPVAIFDVYLKHLSTHTEERKQWDTFQNACRMRPAFDSSPYECIMKYCNTFLTILKILIITVQFNILHDYRLQ